MSRRRLPLAALAAAALVAGCSDSPRISSTDNARTTTATLLSMCAQGNGPGVYATLAEDTRRRFLAAGSVLDGCEEILGLAERGNVAGADAFARARVADVQRRGDQATAVVRLGEHSSTLTLLDTGMEWFVANPPRYEPVGVDDLP
ncbi:MAG TPA: hypothetical protein VG474_17435 [Solirubrobacteraceae bacterium]|nr:hypothetical protein [Solirubrobacteraceae bacterium]